MLIISKLSHDKRVQSSLAQLEYRWSSEGRRSTDDNTQFEPPAMYAVAGAMMLWTWIRLFKSCVIPFHVNLNIFIILTQKLQSHMTPRQVHWYILIITLPKKTFICRLGNKDNILLWKISRCDYNCWCIRSCTEG